MVGETWAHTGTLATSRQRHKSFIIRILRWGGTREIALTPEDNTATKSFHVPFVLDHFKPPPDYGPPGRGSVLKLSGWIPV